MKISPLVPRNTACSTVFETTFVDMLRTALKVGAGLAPRRVASGGAAAGAGRRAFSSLQEALVNVTFVDAEVRGEVTICLSSLLLGALVTAACTVHRQVCCCANEGTSSALVGLANVYR